MDGTFAADEGLRSLYKTLDRLQDELLSVSRKRPDHVILREIDDVEALINDAEDPHAP